MLRRLPSATTRPRRTAATPTAPGPDLPALVPLAEPRPLRVLDLDSECRPDAYLGGDLTTRSLTGIAAQFIGEPATWCRVILATESTTFAEQSIAMLQEFVELYDAADMVTGHNIRRHDLPIISGACMYFGLPPLSPKLTSDTLRDIPKRGLVFSGSQENLGDMLDVLDDKYHMNNARWKRANTLEGADLTRARVTSDVHMHVQVRAALLVRSRPNGAPLLGPPRIWNP
jgi:hypothetical protein